MRNRILLTAGITGLTFASLLAAIPATAATTDSTAQPQGTRFTEISGQHVTDSPGFLTIRGGDRHPSFTVKASSDHAVGDKVKVVDQWWGGTLCTTALGADLKGTCTSTVEIPYGESQPEALITPKGGDQPTSTTGEFHLSFGIPNFDLKIDSYDAAAKKVSVSGVTLPGMDVSLLVQAPGRAPQTAQADATTGRFTATLDDVALRDGVRAYVTVGADTTEGGVVSGSETKWMPGAVPASPKVTTKLSNGLATLTVQGEDGLMASVRYVDGHSAGDALIKDGKATISVRVPTTESRFTVVQMTNYQLESTATAITFNKGVGQAIPDAPSVTKTTVSGDRAAVTVTGTKGAFALIRNDYGEVVGSRLIGATGRTQIVVPAPTDDDNGNFTVTQNLNGATSAATAFTIPVS